MLQKSALTDWYERDVLRNRIRLTAKITVPKRRWLAPAAMEDGAHEMIMIIVCGDSGAGDFLPVCRFERGSDIPCIVPVSVCMCPWVFVLPPRDTISIDPQVL